MRRVGGIFELNPPDVAIMGTVKRVGQAQNGRKLDYIFLLFGKQVA